MKGYIQTLEAVIALGIILLAMTMFLTPERIGDRIDFKDNFYGCIKDVDNKGLLRDYVYTGSEKELSNELRDCLPGLIDFTLRICLTNECMGNIPDVPDVESYVYFVASYDKPKIVKAWLWS